MVELSKGERKVLEIHHRKLGKTREAVIQATPEDEPERYKKILELIGMQQAAIDSLIATGEPGCDLQALRYDPAHLMARPHLRNLQDISLTAIRISESTEEREAYVQRKAQGAHALKSDIATTLNGAFNEIRDILVAHGFRFSSGYEGPSP